MTKNDVSTGEYQNTIEHIDSLSQEAFSGISGLLSLAIGDLKSSNIKGSSNDLIASLKLAKLRADETMNDINVVAEQVGCHYDG